MLVFLPYGSGNFCFSFATGAIFSQTRGVHSLFGRRKWAALPSASMRPKGAFPTDHGFLLERACSGLFLLRNARCFPGFWELCGTGTECLQCLYQKILREARIPASHDGWYKVSAKLVDIVQQNLGLDRAAGFVGIGVVCEGTG